MISSILTILAGIPKMLDFIKWVHGEISDWLVIRANAERSKEIDEGVKEAKKSKNTEKLEDAFK